MKKTTIYTRKRAHAQPKMHPVKRRAIEQTKKSVQASTDAAFQDQIRTVKIKMFLMDDGEDATELLSILAVVIGSPAQAGAAMGWYDTQPWVRQLHGSLRIIQDMCLQGYRWQSQYAPALNRACELAGEDHPGLSVPVFVQAWLDANLMSTMVLEHRVDRTAVLS